jgi:hypothetical protein
MLHSSLLSSSKYALLIKSISMTARTRVSVRTGMYSEIRAMYAAISIGGSLVILNIFLEGELREILSALAQF